MFIVVLVDRDDVAAEVPQEAGHDRADPSGADDGRRLAGEIEPDQSVEREVAVTDPGVRPVDTAVEREDQGQRVLGDGVGGVGGHADDVDAEPLGSLEVDVVETGAPQRDTTRAGGGELLEDLGRDHVVDEHTDRLGSVAELCRLAGQAVTQEREVEPVRFVRAFERGSVVRFRREHPDLGHAEVSRRSGAGAIGQVGQPSVDGRLEAC